MSKLKTVFFCKNCGHESPKWLGKCPSCNQWNTYTEEVIHKDSKNKESGFSKSQSHPILIHEISQTEQQRFSSNNVELDRVLGGGIVPGSVVLIGGEPGIGKSTLMLQVALKISKQKVLYVSGEENETQIKMRAERIGISHNECYILTETLTQNIFRNIDQINPGLVIIDSIQTLTTESIDSTAGSISQIRECAGELQRFAKEKGIPVFLIGHITKDGTIAGPKLLEHMVDVVLQFEGERNMMYRVLRAHKNRFGSTSEIGIFEMMTSGLREVNNPSEILLSHREEQLSGIAISATVEGLRPLMIETQALVSTAVYGTPQRSTTGFDQRRLNMLLAVLEKRCGFRLGNKDVFLNIAGGLRVDDPAIDLGVVVSILSSNQDIPVPSGFCLAAEVGLSGEIRAVNRIEQRISEAEKLGFNSILISKYNMKSDDTKKFNIRVVQIGKIEEALGALFG